VADPTATVLPGTGRALRDRTDPRGRPAAPLATLVVLTDARNATISPASAVPRPPGGPFSSTFRPQEARPAQVLDAAGARSTAHDPTRSRHRRLVDNAQANEPALARTVLDGGRADPDSRGYGAGGG
jgi:hypothetical protein